MGPVWSLIFDTLHFWEGGIRCYQCFSLKCFALKISIKYVHRVWVHIVVADVVILFYAKRHCVLKSIVVRTFISLFRNWKVYAWWNNPEKYCKKISYIWNSKIDPMFFFIFPLLTEKDHFTGWVISSSINLCTVIPRFTRLLWQPKNRVNRNSRYTSHSIDKKCLKKCQKNFY